MKHEIAAICVSGTLLIGCAKGCFLLAEQSKRDKAYTSPPVLKDWRRDIRHCTGESVDTWECIRDPKYVMRREDI